MTVKIESVKDNTVTYTLTDGAEAVLHVALLDADGQAIATNMGWSSLNGGAKMYTLTLQAGTIPAKAGLKVTLLSDAKIMAVPFDLKDIALP